MKENGIEPDQRYPVTLAFLTKALKLAKADKDYAQLKDIYTEFKDVYSEQKDFTKAIFYANQYKQASDSLVKAERKKTAENLQIVYEAEKNEQKISQLNEALNAKASPRRRATEPREWLYFGMFAFLILGVGIYFFFSQPKWQFARDGLNNPSDEAEKSAESTAPPVTTTDLSRLFDKFQDKQSNHKKLPVSTSEGVLLLPIADIIRLEASGSYCTIHLTPHKKILASKPLAEFEPLLDKIDFFRIHKSHIVNIHCVERYIRGEGGMVVMNDGAEVSVSRTVKAELLEKLNIS
ncbi:MAG: LytTR family transcriptional regulator [Cytophagaceae bacterium]|nr:LytTR family transcriptional regulator [Cytophagaceae bacterium]